MRPLSLGFVSLFLLIACWPQKRNNVQLVSGALSSDLDVPFMTIDEYVSSCESWLGPLPQTIDCSDGGENASLEFELVAHSNLGDSESRKVCSNPSFGSLLDQSCDGTSRIFREENANGTLSVAVCRRLYQAGKLNFLSAMISHNPESGGTCFFLYKKETPFVEKGLLPGPGYKGREEIRKVELNWRSPTYMTRDKLGTCVECHSSSPWIRAPAVISRREREGGPALIPRGAQLHASIGHYWVIERARLSQISLSDKGEPAGWRWTPMALNDGEFVQNGIEKPYCMTCHLIGAGQFIRFLAPSAAGSRFSSSVEREIKDDPLARFNARDLDWRAMAWHSSWLKGGVPRKSDSEEDFQLKIGPSMTLFDACARQPSRCAWQTFPEMVKDSQGTKRWEFPAKVSPYDQNQYEKTLLSQIRELQQE